jgi:hypothetical protein
MLTKLQEKRLRRLVHLKEFAPCPVTPYDYELRDKGYVRISTELFHGDTFVSTEITPFGSQHANHLSEENNI